MKTIHKYEHEILRKNEGGFTETHWKALIALNERFGNRYFDILHDGIKFRQYTGVIQIEDLLIEIYPKADKHSGNAAWRNVLIPMLKTSGYLQTETTGEAFVRKQPLSLIHVYFELFLKRMEVLIRRGLIKQYRKESGNTKALKGKLEFARHIQHNLVHRERFYTRHQVYDTDHTLHLILRTAAEIVQYFSRGTGLVDFANRILLSFPEVTPAPVTRALLDKTVIHRKARYYAGALDLARLIILNYSPDIKGGHRKMLSLLFDMNRLWESYVLKSLQNTLRHDVRYRHWRITGQESRSFTRAHRLRPDIVLQNVQTGETIVVDTKWKQPENSSASIADLRQMYVYGRYWQARKTVLLYPSSYPDTGEFQAFIPAPGESGASVFYKTAFIPVITAEGKLNTELGEKIFDLLDKPVEI